MECPNRADLESPSRAGERGFQYARWVYPIGHKLFAPIFAARPVRIAHHPDAALDPLRYKRMRNAACERKPVDEDFESLLHGHAMIL